MLYGLQILWATPTEFAQFIAGNDRTMSDEISFRSSGDDRAILRAAKKIEEWRTITRDERFLIPLFLVRKDNFSGYRIIHNYEDDPIQLSDSMKKTVELNLSIRKEGRFN